VVAVAVVVVEVSVCVCVCLHVGVHLCVLDSKGPDTNTLGIKLLSNLQRDSVKNDENFAWLHGDVTNSLQSIIGTFLWFSSENS
jgi:hypothetical protein